MRVLILSQGTRGDVQPFVALAKELERHGHEIVLGSPRWVADLVDDTTITHIKFSDIERDLMVDASVREGFESNYHGIRQKKLIFKVLQRYRVVTEKILSELACAADWDVDIVVHHATLPGHEVAERIGAKAVPVCLEPSYVPTKEFADPMLPFRLPKFLNTASYRVSRKCAQIMFRNMSEWRREVLKLPSRRHQHDPFIAPNGDPAPVLQAFSKSILPPSTAYPECARITGFWFLDKVNDWKPPRVLSEFLDGGDPPVFVGFGSLASSDPEQKQRLVMDAIKLAGVRAVVVGGSGGIPIVRKRQEIFYLQDVPYDWLFPRMAAVVHHGGSGTTGLALSAARPQVVCPAVYGQPFNAAQMHRIGVATTPLSQHRITAEKLARSIDEAVSDDDMAARAKEFAQRINAEDGVTNAAKILESLAENSN